MRISAIEADIGEEAKAGIADAEAGRYVTIATPGDAKALHQRTIAHPRNRLAADNR